MGITEVDSHDQWHAWRIGRDSANSKLSRQDAEERLANVFPQDSMKTFFNAGFSGQSCPPTTAPNPQ